MSECPTCGELLADWRDIAAGQAAQCTVCHLSHWTVGHADRCRAAHNAEVGRRILGVTKGRKKIPEAVQIWLHKILGAIGNRINERRNRP
jgi:hypothetical protein